MMTARDIISPRITIENDSRPAVTVKASMPIIDVLPRLLDAEDRQLGVMDGTRLIGVIDVTSMAEGLGGIFPARDDCSIVELECAPGDYSASLVSHAAEDADVHVVGLWSLPSEGGKVRIILRLRCEDPTHVVRNLERYGFEVVEIRGNADALLEMAARRFEELQLYLNM